MCIGTDKDEPYRSLALLTEEEAMTITGNIKLDGFPLGPLQAAKIRLVFAAVWHVGTGGMVGHTTIQQASAPLPNPPAPPSSDMPDVVALDGVVTQEG